MRRCFAVIVLAKPLPGVPAVERVALLVWAPLPIDSYLQRQRAATGSNRQQRAATGSNGKRSLDGNCIRFQKQAKQSARASKCLHVTSQRTRAESVYLYPIKLKQEDGNTYRKPADNVITSKECASAAKHGRIAEGQVASSRARVLVA